MKMIKRIMFLVTLLVGVSGFGQFSRLSSLPRPKISSLCALAPDEGDIARPESVQFVETNQDKQMFRFVNVVLAAAAVMAGVMIFFGEDPLYSMAVRGQQYPVMGSDTIMSIKGHGTSDSPVQSKLRWNADPKLADRITNYNRRFAEYAGYWTQESSFLKEVAASKPTEFYDSVTGNLLFTAPIGRSFEEFKDESTVHGWPSFRDPEVNWENVRSLKNGEIVSLTGTHLGHNLPDSKGNRYCINLVSIAGYPAGTTAPAAANY